MAISDILNKFLQRKKQFKEMQAQQRMQELIEERKLSANERELNRYMNEEREEAIKRKLQQIHKFKNDEIWHGKTMLATPNMFRGGGSIMNQPSMLRERTNILNQGRLF